MNTDIVRIGFCVTVLTRDAGRHEVVRFFTSHYYRSNGIISFDADGGRKHFTMSDVVSVIPWVHGTMSGKDISYTFPLLNVESTQKSETMSVYAETDEEYEEALTAAEEEYPYGYD